MDVCWRRTTLTVSSFATPRRMRSFAGSRPLTRTARSTRRGRRTAPGSRSRETERPSWSSTTRRPGSSSLRAAGRWRGRRRSVLPTRSRSTHEMPPTRGGESTRPGPSPSRRTRERLSPATIPATCGRGMPGPAFPSDARSRSSDRVVDLAYNPVSSALAVGYSTRGRRGVRGPRPGRVDGALHRRPGIFPGRRRRRRLQPGWHGPGDGRRFGRRPVLGRDDRGRDRSGHRHRGRLGPRPRLDPVGQRHWSALGRTGRSG